MTAIPSSNAALLLAGVLLVGCGDDEGERVVDLNMDGGGGGTLDAGNDASSLDAARNDGGAPITQPPEVLCTFTRSAIATVSNSAVSPDDPLALSVRNEGASMSWIEFDLGKHQLKTTWFGSDNTSIFTALGDGGVVTTQADPGNLATSTGFLTVWSDDDGAIDVRAQGWSADGRPTAPLGSKLSSDGASSNERTPVLARGDDGNVLLVWQNEGQPNGTALLLDGAGVVVGTPRTLPNFGVQAGQPALTALNGRYLLAWVDPVALRVHMLVLNATGTPIGADVLVDTEANAAGTVDLAVTPAGGAVVFDVRVAQQRPEVRFRSFDGNGVLTGSERVITDYPGTGLQPSIVPLAAGYVVAYRSLKSPDLQLQLVLLDSLGVVTSGISVAPIVDSTVPVALRIAPDGKRMFLGWTDRVAGTASYNLQRTWVTCD